MEHMPSAADDLVAKLVDEVVEETPPNHQLPRIQPPPGGLVPSTTTNLSPEDLWYYTDPQVRLCTVTAGHIR